MMWSSEVIVSTTSGSVDGTTWVPLGAVDPQSAPGGAASPASVPASDEPSFPPEASGAPEFVLLPQPWTAARISASAEASVAQRSMRSV